MKPYIIVAVFAVVIIVLCLVGRSFIAENNKAKSKEKTLMEYEATLELVEDINQNSDFAGLMLLTFSDETEENQQSQGVSDINPRGVVAAEGAVRGYYFDYPKGSSNSRLTQISIKLIPYHVYGIAVGQNISDVTDILEEKGFSEYDKRYLYNDIDLINYRQHQVSIFFDVYKDTGIIKTITVSAFDIEDPTVY